MPTAKQMVDLLEAALSKNAAVAEVVVDGQRVKFDRAQALLELDYWKRQAAKTAGTKPLFRGFDLGSAW